MTWVKLDDQWADHPKFLKVGDFAQLMWVKGLTYSARYLLDGSLPDEVVARLVSVRAWKLVAQKLVDAALWEKVQGGYRIHDYHTYQPLREAVLAERALDAERKKRGRDNRRPLLVRPDERRISDGLHPESGRPDPVPDPDLTRTRSAALGKPEPPTPEHSTPRVDPTSQIRIRAAEPVLPDLSSPAPSGEQVAIALAIRQHAVFRPLDAHGIASHAVTGMIGKGTRLAWVTQAIDDCAGKCVGLGLTAEALQSKLVGFMRHAKPPKADEREQKSGPAYREFPVEPDELERARRLVPRRKIDETPPVSTDEQRARAMALVSGIGKGGT